MWGNAVSVAESWPEHYAKNITIRYPIHVPFAGKGLRLTFDKALRDPDHSDRFRPAYDSGDHLHPSKAGYERMAMEITVQLLK